MPSPDPTKELGKEYTWQKGDCLASIAIKYRQQPIKYLELLELNKSLLQKNNYIMREGDIIEIPDEWFPLSKPSYGTKFIGSKGERIK